MMSEDNTNILYKYRPLYSNWKKERDEETGEEILRKVKNPVLDENTLSLLTKGEFYFSAPNEFNDPFDCYIPTAPHLISLNELDKVLFDRRDKGRLLQILNNKFNNNKLELLNFINRTINNEQDSDFNHEINIQALSIFKICCFSEVCDEIRMWSHYASSHRGVCIGIKSLKKNNKLMFNTTDISMNLASRKVEYDDDIQYLKEIDQTKLTDKEISKYLYHKSRHWKYEKERRIAILDNSLNLKILTLNPEEIFEIIFGLKTPSYIIKFTLQKIIDSKFINIDKVIFYKMEYVSGKYNIQKKRINFSEYIK
ncbi:MAG: DUF2971 domain-containing protein [Spirochaetia bacterium]|nr:DUF2971 domain-containing protein [Spirochaetia bacterium]